MLDLNHLRCFLKVVELGSFSQAANFYDVPKSTISRRVTSLETQLGERLFKRDHNALHLTSKGQILQQQYQAVFAQIQAIESQQLSDEVSGVIKLSIAADLANSAFTQIISQFCQAYPKVNLQCHTARGFEHFALQDFDLALLLKEDALADGDYIARKLFQVPIAIYTSPLEAEKIAQPIAPEQLAKLNCLHALHSNEWVYVRDGNTFRVPVHSHMAIDGINAQKHASIWGGGISRLPVYLCRQEEQSGELVRITTTEQVAPLQVYLAYHERNWLPPAAKKLIEFITERKAQVEDFVRDY